MGTAKGVRECAMDRSVQFGRVRSLRTRRLAPHASIPQRHLPNAKCLIMPSAKCLLPHGHDPQLARRTRRSGVPTFFSLPKCASDPSQLLVRCRPDDLVNAIQPGEHEYNAHLTNFVSSPHFTSPRLYMIRRIPGKRPDRIGVERLRCRTNNIPRIRVEVPV